MPLPRDDNPGTTVEPKYGSMAQMAIYSGLSVGTLKGLLRSGELKSHKIGRRVLIAYSDLDEYIKNKAR